MAAMVKGLIQIRYSGVCELLRLRARGFGGLPGALARWALVKAILLSRVALPLKSLRQKRVSSAARKRAISCFCLSLLLTLESRKSIEPICLSKRVLSIARARSRSVCLWVMLGFSNSTGRNLLRRILASLARVMMVAAFVEAKKRKAFVLQLRESR